MRLICPNCSSEYEVGDDAIPPGGREVQCSNCAHTWFQTDMPVAAPQSGDSAEADDGADVATEPDTAKDETPAAPMRKPLDDAVASILREEAARGDNLPRGGNAAPPPTQPAPKPTEVIDAGKTRERIAQMTIEEGGVTSAQAASGGASAAAAAAGANLRTIPDIQEINAALRARAQASDTSGLTEAEKEEAAERRGFRGGFFGVLILLAIAVAPYFFADQITENLPQTADFMANYMDTMEGLRGWLSAQVETVRGLIGGNEVGNG